MKTDIEIGEYVRSKDGIIGKAEEVSSIGCWIEKDFRISKRDIVNCSKQLIDLIEDKDIVEIELSEEFVEKKDKKKLIQIGDIYTKETLQKDIDNGIITRILTILSYNQYMANCYKVGGEYE